MKDLGLAALQAKPGEVFSEALRSAKCVTPPAYQVPIVSCALTQGEKSFFISVTICIVLWVLYRYNFMGFFYSRQ